MRRLSLPAIPLTLLAALLLSSATALAASPAQADRSPSVAALPACDYLDISTRYTVYKQWRKTLVDTILRVGKSYKPPDLVSVSEANIAGSGRVRAPMIDDLRAMAAASRGAHKGIAVRSAYRSYAQQKAVFQDWVDRRGYQKALLESARAGHSEHQLGTTIDFRSASSTLAPWDYADWGATGPGRWMKKNSWQYGFVLSYPRGSRSETCYTYEPWHFRYFGRALARQIHESGLTTRRYLWTHFETAP
jgi:zinc D-Ala-D-Ala carboxypeptidase